MCVSAIQQPQSMEYTREESPNISSEDECSVIFECGNIQNNEFAYTELTKALMPYVASLMYGEPCSTVPVYKRPKK